MKTILGIDPGLDGALFSLSDAEKIVYDMPTFRIEKNGKSRRMIDLQKLVKVIRDDNPTHIFLEEVGPMPGNGAGAMFTFGRGFGNIEGVIAALGIPYTTIHPQRWKRSMMCPADKDGARMRASQLMPEMAHNWDLKKHDGRAEAALIALYGWNQMGAAHEET